MHESIDGFVMPAPADVAAVTGRLRLLADPTRLKVLCALVQGESDVACLAELAGAGVGTVSQHLAKLRLAGIVRPERHGQHMVYELIDPGIRDLVRSVLPSTLTRASTADATPAVGADG
jgi:DNA-binding transcriptional ArsR family regulator